MEEAGDGEGERKDDVAGWDGAFFQAEEGEGEEGGKGEKFLSGASVPECAVWDEVVSVMGV